MRMHAHACVYVRLGGGGVGVVGRGGCFQTPVGSYWVLFTAFLKSGSEWMPDDAFDKRQETPIYHPASCSYQLICCFLFPLQEMKQSVLLLCMRNNRLKYSKDNLGIAEDNLTTKLVLILMTVRKGKTLEIVLYFVVHLFCQTLLPLCHPLVQTLVPPLPLNLAQAWQQEMWTSVFHREILPLILPLQNPFVNGKLILIINKKPNNICNLQNWREYLISSIVNF